MKRILLISFVFLFSCTSEKEELPKSPYVMVLGIAQDAGYPQMNCKKECCTATWSNTELQRTTSCLAIVDPTTNEQWIIDATPNIKEQLQLLKSKTGTKSKQQINKKGAMAVAMAPFTCVTSFTLVNCVYNFIHFIII